MKRLALTQDELALIERHRADKALYNRAIADALTATALLTLHESTAELVFEAIQSLRRA